ncbi:type II secretion system F family protein [Actinoplanes derwentensis]|uniref:Tight adherence protein B n=1 Tax=Actinoplanes derwentensis TaxID=113562 RepID=A0A1H2CPM0_9ACTN|nr:hypothetical protein [Actinoplanes derwentensis]GID83868.1 hypothetical protein Ade03nite_27920 [Actinoplanes derwentensis]SDT72480.1 tight adherence protein B [Actinoplanes derwentensis]
MAGVNWLLAALLIVAAVVAARPGSAARERLLGPRTWIDLPRIRRAAVSGGPRLAAVAVGIVTVAAGVLGGPVGAIVAAAYAGLGAHEWDRRMKRRRIETRRAADLDEIAHLVAELRAGIPPVIVAASRTGPADPDTEPLGLPGLGTGSLGLPDPGIGSLGLPGPGAGRSVSRGYEAARNGSAGPDARLERLTSAVWHLAERTGAPAADLLERIERDARAADRSARAAGAQAAGSQTTAVMLTALPVAGIGMGYLIGGDPLDVLLYTPWGAGCAIGALILQVAGLKWAQRLTAKVTA